MEIALIGILFLIILILGHEFGHFFAAKLFKMRVDEFGIGFPPRLFSKKKGETIYSFNLLPFGGFVRIHGEHAGKDENLEEPEKSFLRQSTLKRSIVIIAGAFMNFLIGWIAFSIVFTMGVPIRVIIENVLPDGPAAVAGLEPGQRLEGYSSAEEFVSFVDNNRGEEITINELTVTPRLNPPEGEGALGISIAEIGIEKQGIFKSIWLGLRSAVELTGLIIAAFAGLIGGLFSGDFTAVGQVSGPVGVFKILGETSQLGAASLIQFLGLISINLLVLNMIPFPALDGGRFLFILIEKLVGKPINYKVEGMVNVVGFGLLILMMVIVTIRDIINIS